jgi:hypothetical protein
MSLFQNPVSFGQAPGKTGLKPGFSANLKKLFQKLKFWNSRGSFSKSGRRESPVRLSGVFMLLSELGAPIGELWDKIGQIWRRL